MLSRPPEEEGLEELSPPPGPQRGRHGHPQHDLQHIHNDVRLLQLPLARIERELGELRQEVREASIARVALEEEHRAAAAAPAAESESAIRCVAQELSDAMSSNVTRQRQRQSSLGRAHLYPHPYQMNMRRPWPPLCKQYRRQLRGS